MGRRARRKERERAEPATRPSRPQSEGPYMVCGVCNSPVNQTTFIDGVTGEETDIGYFHNLEIVDNYGNIIKSGKDYGHKALPVEGSVTDNSGGCDFCYAPNPRWVFVPRRPIVIRDQFAGNEHDYSSPWSCCNECLPAVKSRNITRMVNRALASSHSPALSGLTRAERDAYRSAVGKLYRLYLDSAPTGPYELKIRPPHRPAGRRGSARGAR